MHTKGPLERDGRRLFVVDELGRKSIAEAYGVEAAKEIASRYNSQPALLEALRMCESILAEHEQYDAGDVLSGETEAAQAARAAIESVS